MKYLIFDMDDTLYLRSDAFVRASIQRFPESADWNPEILYRIRKKHSDFSYEKYGNGLMTQEEMYIYRTRETFAEYGISLTPEESLDFEALYTQTLNQIVLQPTMERILSALHTAGIPMGVITNGPVERQHKKLHALGVERYIPESCWLVSGELGTDKPDPAIFRYAAQKFRLSPQDAWYIGDSFDADVAGAAAAGWHSIWINHRQDPAGPEYVADYEVPSFEALEKLLKKLCHLL